MWCAYDVARQLKDEQRIKNLDRVLHQREPTEQQVSSAITGQQSWLFNEPFKLNGWVLSTIAFKDEVAFDVGPAGYASSAEEAAMHIIEE